MKDLEKIKSEDLGCQVADANPGNFAIEQEVAQLVGATVPAPTEPSADDARELGAQLLVFLRRALTPIRSALRTALADIYAHLDNRCTDYTPAAYDPFRLPAGPYDPMRPLAPRTLPNLLTALTAFAPRKISNGSAPNDGIPDGVSLARLVCSADANAVTAIVDDTPGWVMTKAFPWSQFPNISKAHFLCKGTPTVDVAKNLPNLADFEAPYIEGLYQHVLAQNIKGKENMEFGALKKIEIFGYIGYVIQATDCQHLSLPILEIIHGIGNGVSAIGGMDNLLTLRMPSLTDADSRHYGDSPKALVQDCAALQEIEFGGLTAISRYGSFRLWYNCPNVAIVKFGDGVSINLNLDMYSPSDLGTTFLQNFRDHIALRLTDQGSGKTLTLSQAVFDTIWNADGTPKSTDPDSVIYQINKIIKTDKHWSVNRA